MSLYPNIDPSSKWYERLAYGLCKRTGFGADPETGEVDESVYDGFDIATARWNLTTHQAEYDAAKAHFDDILSNAAHIDKNPIVLIAMDEIKKARHQAVPDAGIND